MRSARSACRRSVRAVIAGNHNGGGPRCKGAVCLRPRRPGLRLSTCVQCCGMASRSAVSRLRLAGPRWSTLLAGLRHPRRFFSELVHRIQEDHILTVAAAMSYFFFFAFFPFLLFLLPLVSLLP